MKTRAQKAIKRLAELQLAKHEAKTLAKFRQRIRQHSSGADERLGIDTSTIRTSQQWSTGGSNS